MVRYNAPRSFDTAYKLAAGLGFEPRYHASEACVLPLDDPAALERSFLKTFPLFNVSNYFFFFNPLLF
jgi:hypothetical protein